MKNTKKSKYYKSKKINQNKKMTTQKKKKRSKKKNNKAGVLTLIEQDQLLALIRYTYFQNQSISPIIEKISTIDLANIINILLHQINNKETYIPPEQYNLNVSLYQLLNLYANDKIRNIDFKNKTKKESKITYSLHALEQMHLPKRKITKNQVEEIIKNKEYTLTDNDTRRVYLDRNSDPNNWIKIITSNKSNPHVITAIRNDPIDLDFSYSALNFLKDNDINKEQILDIIKFGKAEPFEKDKLIIRVNKFSVVTSKNKKKVLSIRML